jgi:iron complex outermembrane receptor protein
MKNPTRLSAPRAWLSCILVAMTPFAGFSQTVAAPAADEPITLNAFQVSSSSTSAYQAKEANSAGRIRQALIDTPQSVSVITRDFMDDIGTVRALDAMKFSASVTEGQFPNRLDRLTIRGFQQDPAQQSQFVDGFRFTAISAGFNADAANLERIEIVKGPNAIIAAAGSPGGTINFIMKAPKFTDAGYLKVQVGQYLANRVEADKTGPVTVGGFKAAYRVVAMASDSKGYQGNQLNRTYLTAPSFTLLLGDATELTIKSYLMKTRVSGLNLPIDPRVSVDNTPVLYPGLNRRSALQGYDNLIVGSRFSGSAELTHRFSDSFQVRLGAMAGVLTSNTLAAGNITGRSLGSAVGNVNPLTGVYTPGTTWTVRNYGTPAQTVTSAASAFPDFTDRTGYTYTVGRGLNQDNIASVQNDYVYKLDQLPYGTHASIVGGVSANTHNYINTGYANRNTPLVGTIDNPDFVASTANAVALPLLKNQQLGELETTGQAYAAGVVRFFEDKLITSASYSYFDYLQRISASSVFGTNPIGKAVPFGSVPGFVNGLVYPTSGYDRIKGHKSNSSFGVVYKPVKNISLFYGRSQNTNPPTLNNIGGTAKANQFGDQYEVGTKSSFNDGKIDVTLTYFNLTQHNVFVYDFVTDRFLALGDVTSHGYEMEVNARLTSELTLIGAASAYKAREGFGRRLRSAPDQSGALALRYQFNAGPLKGAWLMLAGDYLDKRAGDIPGTINIDGASAAPGTVTGTVNGRTLNGIPVEPTFYLQARTILNLTGGYTFNKNWKLWAKVDNLTNKNYIQAALNRGTVTPGTPLSVTSAVTYKF